AMDGLPVTIRLLDPPLHEFLPHAGPALQALCKQLAKELNSSQAIARAVFQAASHVVMARGRVFPHIMVPLVGSVDELNCQVALIKQAAAQMTFGISRDDAQAKFLSFYITNGILPADPFETLDQMTFGISRDDAQAKFLSFYITNGILPADPFETLDQ
ncbi:pyruvate, phosphate dikinase, partial [Haematococcus lacustris]